MTKSLPKEETCENGLPLSREVRVPGCPDGAAALTHLLQKHYCFVPFSFPVLCMEIHNKVLQNLAVPKDGASLWPFFQTGDLRAVQS